MESARLDIVLSHGTTWRKPLKIMQPVYEYKPITSINKTAPLTLTVDHQLPLDHWPVWIESTSSSALNTDKTRERARMAYAADAQTIELNSLNGNNINATGGFLVYQLPVDFEGSTASIVFSGPHADIEFLDLSIGLGFIDIVLTAEQVASVARASKYQLWVQHPNGDRIQWLCGEVSTHDCKDNRAC